MTTIVDRQHVSSVRLLSHPIVIGGIAAGVLDILAAFALQGWLGVAPVRVLQAIASGVLGRGAFAGGAAAALLGLALHFLIAFAAAAVFYAASRVMPVLIRHAVLAGLGYGVVVYAVMNLVVVPLSAFPHPSSFPLDVVIPSVVGHMVLVGLPIGLAVRRFSA